MAHLSARFLIIQSNSSFSSVWKRAPWFLFLLAILLFIVAMVQTCSCTWGAFNHDIKGLDMRYFLINSSFLMPLFKSKIMPAFWRYVKVVRFCKYCRMIFWNLENWAYSHILLKMNPCNPYIGSSHNWGFTQLRDDCNSTLCHSVIMSRFRVEWANKGQEAQRASRALLVHESLNGRRWHGIMLFIYESNKGMHLWRNISIPKQQPKLIVL